MEGNEKTGKFNNGEVAVGFDLTDAYSQISYGPLDGTEVSTVTFGSNGDSYLIPTVLFKRKEVNQWFAGQEALENHGEEGYLVTDLISKAVQGEEVTVGEEKFNPSALLALFMRRALGLVGFKFQVSKIGSLMITVENLSHELIKVLTEAIKSLGIKIPNVYFQNHTESFYYYTVSTDKTLWVRDVLLCDFTGDVLKTCRMECNRNTTPIVAFIDEESFQKIDIKGIKDLNPGDPGALDLDEKFLDTLKNGVGDRLISSIYLIGDNFRQEILPESVKFLCRKGKAFGGNNLYSKGAVHSARSRAKAEEPVSGYVFLGNDKLKSNVGINVINRGEDVYMPLLDAGINWYEARRECSIILNEGNVLTLVITPLTGKNPAMVDITLEDLPKRPAKTSRLRLELCMQTETELKVHITDLGFGNLFPAGNIEWNEVISL